MIAQPETLPIALGTLLITIGSAYGFVSLWENGLKPETLRNISNKILSANLRNGTRKTLEIYLNLNSKIFGKKIVSTRSLTASLILTATWGSSLVLIYSFMYPKFREWIFNIIELSSLRWVALGTLIAILIIDFISICLTRKIYRKVLTKGRKSFLLAFAIDLSKSVVVFYIGITICKLLFVSGTISPPLTSVENWLTPNNLTTSLEVLKDFDPSKGHYENKNTFILDEPLQAQVSYAFPEGVFFMTSLLTSLWLWLYITAYWLAYLTLRIDKAKNLILNRFNIEEKPLAALTALATIVIVAIFLLNYMIKVLLDFFYSS